MARCQKEIMSFYSHQPSFTYVQADTTKLVISIDK